VSEPRLDHAVVSGDHNEWYPGSMKPVERFELCRVGPGLGFNNIEEVACMDEHVGFFFDNCIYCRQEIIVHLLLAEVHPALGIEAVERG